MKQIHIKGRFLFSFLLIVNGLLLYGQTELRFGYECADEIKGPEVKIFIKGPDNMTLKLLVDTVRIFNFYQKDYFKYKGKYILSICLVTEKYGKDSINYDFDLKGNETEVDISASFDFNERPIKKGDAFIKGDNVINGYIHLSKIFKAPKSIDIKMDNEDQEDEYYKGPFFKIKNNSKDTLYGEHLPGYFWGTLSYIRNDSVIFIRIGTLDYNFVDSQPLYPDSIKYATVGSFGMTKKLKPSKYRFEVMLAKKWQSPGVRIFKEHHTFIWWTEVKEFYKLGYYFTVKYKI